MTSRPVIAGQRRRPIPATPPTSAPVPPDPRPSCAHERAQLLASLTFLSVPEAAELLGLSEWTIYAHISSGELKSFDGSAGKRSVARIRRTAIDAFVDAREKKRRKATARRGPTDTSEPPG
jgi:excisionase family DNA binding protein